MAFRTSEVQNMNWYYSRNLLNIDQIEEDVNYQVVPDNTPKCNSTQYENPFQHIVDASETYRGDFDKASVDKLSFNMQELCHEVNNLSEFPCMQSDSSGPSGRTGLLGDVLGQMDGRGATMSSADDIFLNTEMVSSTSQSSPFEHSAGGSSTEAGSSETTSVTMLGYGLNECSSGEVPSDAFMIPDAINVFHQDTGYIDEEDIVLQELQLVITQMTMDSRICFRDALYRLAKRSQNIGELTMHPCSISFITNETLRYGETNYMEVEDYEIDQVVADLMFNDVKHDQLDIFFT